MRVFRPALWLPTLAAAALLSSCSQAGKALGVGAPPLLAQILAEPVLTEDTVERLKAIADAPTSHLPSRPEGRIPGEEDALAEASDGGPAQAPPDPTEAWRRQGYEPRAVAVGDVFSEHAGPLLNKAFSFADLLPAASWESLLAGLGEPRASRVPLTLTVRDLASLRESLADPEIPFPTRSVAFDLRMETVATDEESLGALFRRLRQGGASFPEELQRRIREVEARLEGGERLFVVTSVSRSLSARAHYPGAPLGRRDADAIRNAALLAYPHLNGLEAQREGNAVTLHREPELYWEFDTRELALEPGGLAILPLDSELALSRAPASAASGR